MAEFPLISVVIPTYNRADDLHRALTSVISQTYTNFEVLVVDNHSTDSTDEVIHQFSDERIRLFKINNDGIIAKSRNLGVSKAKGEWIAFLDSDDWWESEKLKISIESAVKNKVDIVYHDLYLITSSSQKFRFKKVKTKELSKQSFDDLLSNGNAIINSSVLFKRSIIEEVGVLNEGKEYIAWEDYDFWLSIARHEKKFYRIPLTLGNYWAGGGNVSNDKRTLDILTQIEEKFPTDLVRLKPWWIPYTRAKVYYSQRKYDLSLIELNKIETDSLNHSIKKYILMLLVKTRTMF
ncbi:glycosyltransferase family 2 protein [Leptospira idonii]|uniref:Glycosyltransferase n=1 Tax=Leptospira idonii TaxID=1193500 RepID=A0A4R9LVQ3_9LEPT|nr:glycosyltransferase [Leptospira idonii]TGN18280.1 glycosyltransferase [Leptospira idonii]